MLLGYRASRGSFNDPLVVEDLLVVGYFALALRLKHNYLELVFLAALRLVILLVDGRH